MNNNPVQPMGTHSSFNATDADLKIQSSDDVLFLIHRKNLEANTGAFPGPEFDTNEEIVRLSEPAKVLEVIFQFVYPRKHPTLQSLDFETLMDVAQTVEKYDVFSAMMTCEVRLSEFLPQHAEAIFWHAVKHEYTNLMDKAAFHLLSRRMHLKTWKELPRPWKIPWVGYRNAWSEELERVTASIEDKFRGEDICTEECNEFGYTQEYVCRHCRMFLIAWVADLEKMDSISDMKERIKEGIQFEEDPWSQIETEEQPLCKTCTGEGCRSIRWVARNMEQRVESLKPLSHFFPSSDGTVE